MHNYACIFRDCGEGRGRTGVPSVASQMSSTKPTFFATLLPDASRAKRVMVDSSSGLLSLSEVDPALLKLMSYTVEIANFLDGKAVLRFERVGSKGSGAVEMHIIWGVILNRTLRGSACSPR
jgi:hypothetical protein